MNHSKAQIVATIGPATVDLEAVRALIGVGMDVARLNFSHGNYEFHRRAIANVRTAAAEFGRRIPIVQDLSGPRIDENGTHMFDDSSLSPLTDKDREDIGFGIEQGVDYIALSFVGTGSDIEELRQECANRGVSIPVIAKIERKEAIRNLPGIVASADALMIARGDLGNEIPLEQIPYVQHNIIQMCNFAHKPVITATQMLLSMVSNDTPTRAEVSDVAYAIISGSDAVMLSEETATGHYPLQAVETMERIIIEAERHMPQAAAHLL